MDEELHFPTKWHVEDFSEPRDPYEPNRPQGRDRRRIGAAEDCQECLNKGHANHCNIIPMPEPICAQNVRPQTRSGDTEDNFNTKKGRKYQIDFPRNAKLLFFSCGKPAKAEDINDSNNRHEYLHRAVEFFTPAALFLKILYIHCCLHNFFCVIFGGKFLDQLQDCDGSRPQSVRGCIGLHHVRTEFTEWHEHVSAPFLKVHL
mmetsp:Transcript_112265/g.317325  ORF Transcript_112265/g.317325 Transcript_112265/m.317325 type:complete len:203 (-) Transcript_112265:299-907(-)